MLNTQYSSIVLKPHRVTDRRGASMGERGLEIEQVRYDRIACITFPKSFAFDQRLEHKVPKTLGILQRRDVVDAGFEGFRKEGPVALVKVQAGEFARTDGREEKAIRPLM